MNQKVTTNVLIVAAIGLVAALMLLTLDVPGLIVCALFGVPVAVYVGTVVADVVKNAEYIDPVLNAYVARWRAWLKREDKPQAYTGETKRLSEV